MKSVVFAHTVPQYLEQCGCQTVRKPAKKEKDRDNSEGSDVLVFLMVTVYSMQARPVKLAFLISLNFV